MGDVLSKLGEGLSNSFLMAWEVWWALVLGFAISRDPVCGMTVDRYKAVKADSAGETHYFCSERCLNAFEHSGPG